jgi:hypothetical protein
MLRGHRLDQLIAGRCDGLIDDGAISRGGSPSPETSVRVAMRDVADGAAELS